jgi:hypothetical protein
MFFFVETAKIIVSRGYRLAWREGRSFDIRCLFKKEREREKRERKRERERLALNGVLKCRR